MKAFVGAAIAVAGLIFVTTAAQATPTETLTWSGTLGYGSNGTPAQFAGAGAAGASLTGDAFTIELIYDPATLTSDSCGVSSNTDCSFVFGASGVTEEITVKGSEKTYTSAGPGGSLGVNVSPDGFNLSIGGTPQFGFNITGTFAGFGSNANIEDFNIASTSVTGNFGDSGLTGGAQVGNGSGTYTFSAAYSSGVTSVPEPISVSLFGAGLAGMAAIRRRKKAKQV
jgi:PEP-CTERM motif